MRVDRRSFAATAYVQEAIEPGTWPAVDAARGHLPPPFWPWAASWWKPGDPVGCLVKAGALIAAEIDRLQRAASPSPADGAREESDAS